MTLTIQDLGALGELLGAVAVLATLVYLALQTQQNTMAIAAQLDATRITTSQNLQLTLATSTELEQALAEDRIDGPTVPQMRRAQYWLAQFLTFQWQVHHAQQGLLPTVDEAVLRRTVRAIFVSFRSFEGWWEGAKIFFLPDFVEWVEEQRSKAASRR